MPLGGNFCIIQYMCYHVERQELGKLCGEAYSTSSLRGMGHAFNFNILLSRELVTTVNITAQKKECYLEFASTESLTHYYISPITNYGMHCTSENGGVAMVATM